MKKILLLIMIASLSLFASEEIHNFKYETNYKKALKKAQKEDKLLIVMMSLSTCPVCSYMKDIVFERQEVLNYLKQNYVMVINDIDWDDYAPRFKTTHVPTFFFIDPDTEEELREKKVGGSKPKDFIQELTDVKIFDIERYTTPAQ